MSNSEYVDIEVDLEEEVMCSLMEMWAQNHLDDPSLEVFNKIAAKVGIDINEVQRALGAGVMNQIIIDAIHAKMAEEEKKDAEKK